MKKAEELLNEHGCSEIPFDENVTMYYPAILNAMEEYAAQFKPAEIIKNGNVNIKPIKTGIDWDKVYKEFDKLVYEFRKSGSEASPGMCIFWLKEIIEKELNSSE